LKRVLVHGNERMSAVYIDKLDGSSSGSSRAKAPPAQLRTIELLLEGRRSARHLSPTV
jgi:hypothetical protein